MCARGMDTPTPVPTHDARVSHLFRPRGSLLNHGRIGRTRPRAPPQSGRHRGIRNRRKRRQMGLLWALSSPFGGRVRMHSSDGARSRRCVRLCFCGEHMVIAGAACARGWPAEPPRLGRVLLRSWTGQMAQQRMQRSESPKSVLRDGQHGNVDGGTHVSVPTKATTVTHIEPARRLVVRATGHASDGGVVLAHALGQEREPMLRSRPSQAVAQHRGSSHGSQSLGLLGQPLALWPCE